MSYHANLWLDATPADLRDRRAAERARKEHATVQARIDLARMSDESLAAYILDLRKLNYNAAEMRDGRSFASTHRLLEAAWREQDRRAK
jgi:hypothetical protein